MKFQLDEFHRNTPDEELLADLRRVASLLESGQQKITFRSYQQRGKFSAGTIAARFGSWNKALDLAGIGFTEEKNVSVDALFDNLRKVWIAKGEQPVFRDLASPPSSYQVSLYANRFGSWRKALTKFVEYIDSDEWFAVVESSLDESGLDESAIPPTTRKRTGRTITERMRFRILPRDGFSCQSCGASPLSDRGVQLHVDHIIPWSKGGETEDANLGTKCSRCNLGKGNAFGQ